MVCSEFKVDITNIEPIKRILMIISSVLQYQISKHKMNLKCLSFQMIHITIQFFRLQYNSFSHYNRLK